MDRIDGGRKSLASCQKPGLNSPLESLKLRLPGVDPAAYNHQ
jgi:hypothetical protein